MGAFLQKTYQIVGICVRHDHRSTNRFREVLQLLDIFDFADQVRNLRIRSRDVIASVGGWEKFLGAFVEDLHKFVFEVVGPAQS